jgi:hypothetical protein
MSPGPDIAKFTSTSAGDNRILIANGSGNIGSLGYTPFNNTFQFSSYGNLDLCFGSNNLTVEIMRLKANGDVGIGQTNPQARLHVSGGSVVFDGTTGSTPVSGGGTRMMWIPASSAFRAGNVSGTQWDPANIGGSSFAANYNCQASGFYSVAMGYNSTASGNGSFVFGGNPNSANGQQGVVIFGDYVGSALTAPLNDRMYCHFVNGYQFYTNSTNSIGMQALANANAWSTISDSTKKTNFFQPDGEEFLGKISKMRLGSWNYKIQDPRQYRHYGPMAQEFFSAFGHDPFGTIGCDTLLNSADVDGVAFIALQALEKRTAELKLALQMLQWKMDEMEKMKNESSQLKKEVDDQQLQMKKQLEDLKTENASLKSDILLIKNQLGIGVQSDNHK